ncbi:MAG: hypothetical protein HDS64_09680 [Bacteroidales bacterium]|nr:hypothetical protein [Bacteroidales bacterium]
MANKISNQMLCAIGENLVSSQLIARGWPTVNVNHSINNFKGSDLFCQHGLDSTEIIGIQVKATTKSSFFVGLKTEECADLNFLSKKITGPWVFVHVKSFVPLDVDYYVLPRQAVIDLLYQGHDWYLHKWNRVATPSLSSSPAAMSIRWLRGENDQSRNASVIFKNPYPGDIFRQTVSWDNIW